MPSSRRITIVQTSLRRYRIEFFELLRTELARHGVVLQLLHGRAVGEERERRDEATLDWAEEFHNVVLPAPRRALVWQPILGRLAGSDLVIVEQANRLLLNHLLVARRALGWGGLAFWGHGANLQEPPDSWANRRKRTYSARCDWWFAYTEGSARRVADLGFPRERITVVQNAIDTSTLVAQCDSVTEEQRAAARAALGLDGPVLLYCGALAKDKRLPWLFEAFARIRAERPDCGLVLIGDGPEVGLVRAAAAADPSIRYLGAKVGEAKALQLAAADLLVMSGLVGLGVLDSFAAGKPLVTTAYSYHSPEFEYLTSGRNGLVTPDDPAAFAAGVVGLLAAPERMAAMSREARADAANYSVEAMAGRFRSGVLACLANLASRRG